MTANPDKQDDPYRVNKKLAKLPRGALVSKRPIPRPLITTSYASKAEPKVVYLSTKTHFMSAIKRIEKLLRRSQSRAVQAVTTRVRASSKVQRRQQRHGGQDDDEILQVATALHENDKVETIIAKGTGRAIVKTMQVGLWFQERPEYDVTLKTASVGAIDDISVDRDPSAQPVNESERSSAGQSGAKLSVFDLDQVDVDEETDGYSRLRQLSVLEVHIRLR